MSYRILFLTFIFSNALSSLIYPVTIGGFSPTEDTILEQFMTSPTSDLAIGIKTSDLLLVSQVNTNAILYFQQAGNTWLWTKELAQNDNLIQLAFRQTDSQRLAVLYESSLLIVLNVADGSIIRAQSHTQMQCATIGCVMSYQSNNIDLIAGFWDGTKSVLGFTSYNPDSNIPSQNILYLYYPGYVLKNPSEPTYTGVNTLLMMLYATPGNIAIVINIAINPFSTLNYLVSMIPNTFPRCIKYFNSPGNERVFGYLDGASANTFHFIRYMDSTTSYSIDTYASYTAITATSVEFHDMCVLTKFTFVALVYFHGDNQLILIDGYMAAPASHTLTLTKIFSSVLPLTLSNAQIISGKYYAGGNNAQDAFASDSLSLNKIGFVLSFQQPENIQTLPAQAVVDSVPSTTGSSPLFTLQFSAQALQTVAMSYTSMTLTPNSLLSPIVESSVEPKCLTKVSMAGYTLNRNVYVGETFTENAVPASFLSCAGVTCTYLAVLSITNDIDLIYTYNLLTNQVTFKTLNNAKDALILKVRMIAIPPPSMRTSCSYYYDHFQLTVIAPLIVSSVIPTITYNLATAQLDTTLSPFANNKGITGDSKLDIVYQLVKASDGSSYSPGVVVNFDPSTRVVSVKTSDDTYPRLNQMKLISSFAYYPAYTVDVPFTIVLEKCFLTKISSPTQTSFIYQIGQPLQTFSVTPFTSLYDPDCGPFIYTTTVTPLSLGITLINPLTFNVQTMNQAYDGRYGVSVNSELRQSVTNVLYKSSNIAFDIVLFSPVVTFITPVMIDSVTYYLKDPVMIVQIPIFPSSKTYIQAKYELYNSDGTLIDIDLLTFDALTRKLQIESSDLTKMGVYTLKIRAFYSELMPYEVWSQEFTVNVFHWCKKNLIKAPNLQDVEYDVSDPQLSFQLPKWSMSMSAECQPVTYLAKLQDGRALPSFIKFDQQSITFKFFTPQPKDVKTYPISIKATTLYFDEASDTVALFTLEVKCKVKKLYTQDHDLNVDFKQGSLMPTTIKIQEFMTQPACSGTDIMYEAKMSDGNIIPDYIKFDNAVGEKSLIISDDSRMNIGKIEVKITASLSASLKGYIIVQINIVAGSAGSDLSDSEGSIFLNPATIEIKANSTFSYISKDFLKETKKPYKLLNLDQSLTFITLQAETQKLIFTPAYKDIGLYKVFLLSQTDKQPPLQIIQILNIKVNPSKAGKSFKDIQAVISTISKGGLVYIDFNQKMKKARNLTHTQLQVMISDKEDRIKSDVQFNWTFIDFLESQPSGSISSEEGYEYSRIILQLGFEDPLSISLKEYDFLNVIFANKSIIQASESGMLIGYKYRVNKKIPRQLDGSVASKYLDKFSSMVQKGINIIASSNTFIQFFLSLYILKNEQSSISNINAILGISVFIHILHYALERYQKYPFFIVLIKYRHYKILDFLYGLFVYNFVIMMLIEYSLQLMIFALVNIAQYDSIETTGQLLSYTVATGLLALYIFIMCMIWYLVEEMKEKDNNDLINQYPKFHALFALLRTQNKEALKYHVFFLARRLILAGIIVFVNDHIFQIMCLVFVSLYSIQYMIRVRPFDEPGLNRLEILNELIILICCYHLLFFSETNPDFRLKYMAGWSLDALIIFQFFLNTVTYAYTSSARMRLILRAYLLKMKNRIQIVNQARITAKTELINKEFSEFNNIFAHQKSLGLAYRLEEMQSATPINTEYRLQESVKKEESIFVEDSIDQEEDQQMDRTADLKMRTSQMNEDSQIMNRSMGMEPITTMPIFSDLFVDQSLKNQVTANSSQNFNIEASIRNFEKKRVRLGQWQ